MGWRLTLGGRDASGVTAPLLVLFLGGCVASSELEPFPLYGRSLTASPAGTVAAGRVELESGLALDPGDAGAVLSLVTAGIADDTDVFLGLDPWLWVEGGPDGLGDLYLGSQHRFLNAGDWAPALALRGTVKLPVADEGLGTGEADVFLGLAGTRDVGPAHLVGYYEAGLLGEPDGPGTDLQHLVSVVAATGLADPGLGAFLELALLHAHELDLDQGTASLGLEWQLDLRWTLDLGVSLGLTDDAADLTLRGGVVFVLVEARSDA